MRATALSGLGASALLCWACTNAANYSEENQRRVALAAPAHQEQRTRSDHPVRLERREVESFFLFYEASGP
jgi:hypothetical protein